MVNIRVFNSCELHWVDEFLWSKFGHSAASFRPVFSSQLAVTVDIGVSGADARDEEVLMSVLFPEDPYRTQLLAMGLWGKLETLQCLNWCWVYHNDVSRDTGVSPVSKDISDEMKDFVVSAIYEVEGKF